MTLSWIKLATNIPAHPKSDLLEAALATPRAWTHVVELWLWATHARSSGDLSGLPAGIIAKRAGWGGDPEAFVEALRLTGWLDENSHLHGWADTYGRALEKSVKDAGRRSDARAGPAHPPRGASAAQALAPQVEEKRREESRREEKRESAAPPAAPPPSPVESEDQAETQQERAESRYAKRVAGQAYEQHNSKKAAAEAIYGRPQTPRDLLLLEVDGEPLASTWGKRFRALDGKAGRPTLAEVVENLWKYAEAKSWGISGKTVLAWWVNQLAKDNDKFRRAWERDGGTTAVSSDPLWPAWRKLKDDPTKDPGPFEEWKLKREELGSGSPKPSGGTPAAPPIAPRVIEEPDPAEVAAAKAALAKLSFGAGKRPLTPGRAALDRMLPAALATDGDSR